MIRVWLPAALRARILDEARTAAPRECCGLLEGAREDGDFHIAALHPAGNLDGDPTRFLIDPADQFAAQRAARAAGRAVIGCYHSHPGGAARPSAADLAGATEEDFLWLIAAEEGLAAFIHRGGGFAPAAWAEG